MGTFLFGTIGFFFLVFLLLMFRNKTQSGVSSLIWNSSGWGNEYKDVLNLTNKEQHLLNYISKENDFSKYKYAYNAISFYKLEVIRVFLLALRALDYENRSKEKAKYICLYCDYLLSEKYLFRQYDNDISERLHLAEYERKIIIALCKDARPLTDEEEKKLFSSDIKRRDTYYNKLVDGYKDGHKFYVGIKRLESLNDTFTVKRNFYYKAYRFMIDKDRLISLKLYIHYLSINPDSTTNLSISKANLKKIFDNESQKNSFDNIIKQFKVDKDLDAAFELIDNIFTVKRKKINIEEDAINSATEDLNSVVEVLNKYLEEDDNKEPVFGAKQMSEIKNTGNIRLSTMQKEFIDYFIAKSYKLSSSEIDTFANSKGVFKSQLIDNLNEEYFDQFDDLLIEEIDNYLILNKDYYRQIAKV